jgi:hypothetical protein
MPEGDRLILEHIAAELERLQRRAPSVRFIILVLIVAFVGGCVSTTPITPPPAAAALPVSSEPPGIPVSLSGAEVGAIQEGLRPFLKDPESATLSGIVLAARQANGDVTACGDTFEGPFMATVRSGRVLDATIATDQHGVEALTLRCRQAGVPL